MTRLEPKMTTITTFLSLVFTGVHSRHLALRDRAEQGDHLVGWVLGVIGAIAIAALVIGALSGWFSARLAELG